MPLNRVDGPTVREAKADLNEVEMPLDQAKESVGRAVRQTIRRVDAALKEFGDKGQVGRWCSGQESPNLARLWQQPDVRRELVLALAEESGLWDVERNIRERRRA